MIQEWLKKSESIPRKHGLYRMEAILEALGNPEFWVEEYSYCGNEWKRVHSCDDHGLCEGAWIASRDIHFTA